LGDDRAVGYATQPIEKSTELLFMQGLVLPNCRWSVQATRWIPLTTGENALGMDTRHCQKMQGQA